MVMKEESRGEEAKFGGLARACDSCSVVPSAVFCRADSAYLCVGCDTRVHTANKVASRHERVWMCEVCERAPAALTCKADAAVLCTACDADIHSANPLARSHHRVPILPISGRLFGRGGEEREEEAASWLLLNPRRNQNGGGDGGEFFYGGEVEDYLDLVEYGSCTENHHEQSSQNQQFNNQCQQQQKSDGSDSVVPVQCLEIKDAKENQHDQKFMEMEFEGSMAGHSYTASLSQSLSHSSMDAGIVPDTTMTDISNSHIGSCKVTAELSTGPPLQIPPQFSSTDRKASVLRYKEKRKNRKFEKRIRYASRKAYAETRPRIKGRFAKRTDVEVEVDQIYSVNAIAEAGYGIVPSF